ncbi:saccharopine dehydrogenase NADP-binding domain-containing protein [Litoribacter alkaliphilus]|uniref:Saccharopine dehydrogenase NADP-binding domain-containing protein n=1 Tax=Litoribacter ruber TaxID=702568 RepID=A0AAP2G234_9BACT|nr:saccharopine dehydrogenase C-terminal domain-containing protein [Litoribacter alkaliphilus]MBS9525559.1 saccharopine dehydrogenase NADP-binding domain-containing protein [Litoribacter alkaliphilus]
MQTILIIGAGKSATVLIDYLIEKANLKNRKIILADTSLELAEKKTKGQPNAEAAILDIHDQPAREALVRRADLVISMLPAFLHPVVARDCLKFGKHFFTASYESDDLRAMAEEIENKNLLFLNECGLDPGIDHMSAMKIIDEEKKKGHEITMFKSFTGGLLAPESEDNPWKYKFTWNPRNVVLAGQGVSRFIRNGKLKFIPYHMLFRRTEPIHFDEVGEFDGYPNRDSLSYRKTYGLENIPTILRGTLRRAGFCKSWDVFVQLGLTDDSFQMDLPDNFTKRMFFNSFLPNHESRMEEDKLHELLPWIDDEVIDKIKWLGMFSDEPLPIFKGSPAKILQTLLEEKWALKADDKDMIVMQHQFEVKTAEGVEKITSSLVIKGQNQDYTAMAKTVGLPLAIAVDLFMDGKLDIKGLQLPIKPEIYLPILGELEKHGIVFNEKSEAIPA